MKIAIIGSGISGLGAAWLLHKIHDITVYEANSYAGGHSRTIKIDIGSQKVAVDTGFIVFNHRNYPHLTSFFNHLGVPTVESDMSFGVSIGDSWLEYGSKGMFAQKKNILRPAFWGMLFDIVRFNKSALTFLKGREDISLRDFLDQMRLGDWFRRYYLQAMGAAIWSCSVNTILDFPARTFLQFFENHGLLTVNSHPQWHTVAGGSREYVQRLTSSFEDRIRLNCAVEKVVRENGKISVRDKHDSVEIYDHVIFACHADQALRMIDEASEEEKSVLGAFQYQENRIVVHSDSSFMPERKACWSSWIYRSENFSDAKPVVSLSYWMNRLQKLKTDKPVFVTLNPGRRPSPELVYDEHSFTHPIFNLETLEAQNRLNLIQGSGNIWHCGAYQRYGFHEDGLLSAVHVAGKLGVSPPWK